MRKQDLKKAYSKPPQAFHYAVIRSLNSIDEKQPVKAKSRVMRNAIVCALVLAVGVAGVVSASAIFPMTVNRNGSYGMSIELEPTNNGTDSISTNDMSIQLSAGSKSAHEYVKFNIGYLPEGVVSYYDQGKYKYSLNGGDDGQFFSFSTQRIVEKQTITTTFIKDYEQFEINGNQAVLAHVDSINELTKCFYIYFENEALLIQCYISDDVSDEEIIKVMENLSVTEGTEDDYDSATLSEVKKSLADKAKEAFDSTTQAAYDAWLKSNTTHQISVVDIGTPLSYAEDLKEFNGTYTVDSIEVLDNISGLDEKFFDISSKEDLSDYADENGNLLPYTRETWKYGDGVNTTNELVASETVNTRFVYVTLTVDNTNNHADTFYLEQFSLNMIDPDILQENNGIYKYTEADAEPEENIWVNSRSLYGEIDYIDNNNVDYDAEIVGALYGYYELSVPADSIETVHLGFWADEDTLDKLYLEVNNYWCNRALFDPDTNQFVYNKNPDTEYSVAYIKVQ